jgi:hypothetical protein
VAKSDTKNRLGPGRELAVLATLRQTTARDVARRTALPEWRVSRILAGVARPTAEELRVLRLALFDDGGPGSTLAPGCEPNAKVGEA